MKRDELIEAMARAMYEADDVWHVAFQWPDLPEIGGADGYRAIATAALKALRDTLEPVGYLQAKATNRAKILGLIPLPQEAHDRGWTETPLYALPKVKL